MHPSFHCTFFPGMPSSAAPGSPIIDRSRSAMSAWPSPRINRLGTPNIPAIRFARGGDFRGYLVHTIVTVCKVARPPRTDQTDIRGGTPLRFAGCAKDQNRLIRLEPMLHVHLQSRERCRIFASHQALTPRRNAHTRGTTRSPWRSIGAVNEQQGCRWLRLRAFPLSRLTKLD